jgi:hypothetical protein
VKSMCQRYTIQGISISFSYPSGLAAGTGR